jgi:hypothetical protein
MLTNAAAIPSPMVVVHVFALQSDGPSGVTALLPVHMEL